MGVGARKGKVRVGERERERELGKTKVRSEEVREIGSIKKIAER